MLCTTKKEIVFCDCCFEELEFDRGDADYFDSPLEKAKSEGWEISEDGYHTRCPLCRKYSD